MKKRRLPDPGILVEDGAVIVIRKPGGLLTQAPPGIDSLELRVKQFLKERDQKQGEVYLGVPHRLDRPVSGVMVVVKNVRAANRISEQIRERTVNKTYWALVAGSPAEPEGTWTDWMRKLPDEAKSEIVEEDHPDAKQAKLVYRTLAEKKISIPGDEPQTSDPILFSLLEIRLETGRTHQIRLQCSARGLPIVGDSQYSSEISFGPQVIDFRKRWIGLHARELGFTHPIGKYPIDVQAPLFRHWLPYQSLLSTHLNEDDFAMESLD
ncbi:MAG: RNA pseudouridine synthase [Planctomycetota bacterium]